MQTSILNQFRLDGQAALIVGGNRGLGFEIAKATEWGKRVLCLYRPKNGRSLSAMIAGCSAVTVREYREPAELKDIFEEFLCASKSGETKS